MSFRSIALGVSLFASLAAFAGCGAAPDGGEAPGAAAEAIKGGYDDANDTAVVDIAWISGQFFAECSGSLIAPNLVLTARHCVANIQNGDQGIACGLSSFLDADKPANFYVSTKQFLSMNPSDWHTVKEVIVQKNTSVCGYDVAMIVLSENIDPAEAKPLVPRVDTPLVKGEQYSAIGFGGTVDNGTGAGQRRRLDNLFVDCVGDCPAVYVNKNLEFVGDHGICEGDSGGPSIDLQNRVIGVTSRGGAGCTSPVYGYVYGQADWIKENALHAASVGGYPAPAWATGFPTDPAFGFPVGETCPMEGCASGLSLKDADGCYCTRLCNDIATCGDGFSCNDISGTKVCQRPEPQNSGNGSSSGGGSTPSTKSGCSAGGVDPTKPVPWSTGVAVVGLALALLRRRGRGTTVGR